MVVCITNSPKDNIILFPKTVEYYQVQITKLLETEKYVEAIDLLKFLLQCQGEDPRAYEEWKVLLEWLQTQFSSLSVESEEEVDETESDLLSKHVKSKANEDNTYVKNLLDMLLQPTSTDKKFLALDQLVFIDHPQINETLLRWMENVDLHPLVQFKILQTLKLREMKGNVSVQRSGETLTLDVADTPLVYDDYPESIRLIMNHVQDISEINHPALAYFAEQTWQAFLSYVYGTSIYNQITQENRSNIKVWAAALHYISIETMLGQTDVKETLMLYEVPEKSNFQWERAYRCIKNFVDSAFRSMK